MFPFRAFGDNKGTVLLPERFGKVTNHTFDHDEIGGKLLYTGKTEATRKIVYNATTTKGSALFRRRAI